MGTFGRPCFAKSKHRLSENGVYRQSQPSAEALCYAFRSSAKIASRSLFLAVSSIFFCSNSFSFICAVPCIKTLLSGFSNIYSQVPFISVFHAGEFSCTRPARLNPKRAGLISMIIGSSHAAEVSSAIPILPLMRCSYLPMRCSVVCQH